MKTFIVGNGPSLALMDLNKLSGHKTYAVNRIWKLFDKTDWRPTDYIRAELPAYDEKAVIEDCEKMYNVSRLHLQAGFYKYYKQPGIEYFDTCLGEEPHDWHLPRICGYGTVVNIAVQLAILEGADEVYLIGCDLGLPNHFYGKEGTNKDSLPVSAHEIAKRCSSIPIYNATVGGSLEVYPRVSYLDVL